MTTIKWERAVPGKCGRELAKALRGMGVTDVKSLYAHANEVQKAIKTIYMPEVGKVLGKAQKIASETGEVAWGSIYGFNEIFEDLMYKNGVFTVEQARSKLVLVARLIAKSKGANLASLAKFATDGVDSEVVISNPVTEEDSSE